MKKKQEAKEVKVLQVVKHFLATMSFSTNDEKGVEKPHDDALVIKAIINNFKVRKAFIDDKSNVNPLSY